MSPLGCPRIYALVYFQLQGKMMAVYKTMHEGREARGRGRSAATACGPTRSMTGDLLASLREVVLLSGSVRADRFNTPIARSILTLPIDPERTLLDQWSDQAARLAGTLTHLPLPVRVMLDRDTPLPVLPANSQAVAFSVERDPYDYRGTGGVLHDLAEAYYDDDDYILVANGAQVVIGSLLDHATALADKGSDVVVAAHRDGTPSGLMLVRCGTLRDIPAAGFVDMKEQALPLIARRHDVRVAMFERPTAQPIRGLSDYIAALRIHHHQSADRPVDHNPFAENLSSTFAVVEYGAQVEGGALLHDAVVLAGARVENGAAVVRSLVCPGGRVRAGQRVVDRIVGGPAKPIRRQGDR